MSKPVRASRCGTNSGWGLHQYYGETPCDACVKAKAEYDRRRLAAGENTLRNRLAAKAQHKALQELRRRHLDEYGELYASWKARVFDEAGIAPRWDLAKHFPRDTEATP